MSERILEDNDAASSDRRVEQRRVDDQMMYERRDAFDNNHSKFTELEIVRNIFGSIVDKLPDSMKSDDLRKMRMYLEDITYSFEEDTSFLTVRDDSGEAIDLREEIGPYTLSLLTSITIIESEGLIQDLSDQQI